MNDPRFSQLNDLFNSVLRVDLDSKNSPYVSPDPPSYSAVAESITGLQASNVTDSTEVSSIISDERVGQFLAYLRSVELAELDASDLLRRAIFIVIDHPIFYKELIQAFRAQEDEATSFASFSRILLQLISLSCGENQEVGSKHEQQGNDLNSEKISDGIDMINSDSVLSASSVCDSDSKSELCCPSTFSQQERSAEECERQTSNCDLDEDYDRLDKPCNHVCDEITEPTQEVQEEVHVALYEQEEIVTNPATNDHILSDLLLSHERGLDSMQKMRELEDAMIKAAVTGIAMTQTGGDVSGSETSKGSETGRESLTQEIRCYSAQIEWQRRKVAGEANKHIDMVMDMVGLEAVKENFLDINDRATISKYQDISIKDQRFNAVFVGNPGTGKTTVAGHYASFLVSVGALRSKHFVETSGSILAANGISGAEKMIEDVLEHSGGTIFIDEAYHLTNRQSYGGGQVLDFLLAEMEKYVGKIVFILAGSSKQMEKVFEYSPGLTSKVPHKFVFPDYNDEELLEMLEKKVTKRWNCRMQIQCGMRGLYARIAIRRLGRGRGRESFGNARALENLLDNICARQARRLKRLELQDQSPEYFLLVKEDLIGPDPSKAIVESSAWKQLQAMIGLQAVKNSILSMISMIQENYQRELHEQAPMMVSLNRVFLGNPGTGKTTVAKLYGQILVDLGLLTNGEVIVKNPADFVGSALGESESNTKSILASTIGKVLVIDEAYMLGGNSSDGVGKSDTYKSAIIDTIVAEVQGVPGDDRCVLMLGYESLLREMFQNSNPGLSRRFAIEDAFRFDDYNNSELMEILELKMKQQHLYATKEAKETAIQVLDRARNRPNFGNGGEVENLLTKAKGNYQYRMAHLSYHERPINVLFEPQDFDPQFDRVERSLENIEKLFQDVVGCDNIKLKLREYQRIASSMDLDKAKKLIPTNFIFKGPPGTGKTTFARKMGEVFYEMGFLSSKDIYEHSASDLIGAYIGHTAPKTKKLFEKSLGRVLFIDEAYRLSTGHFAKEATDEIVGMLTSEKFASKLVVILAGYEEDMNQLIAANSGISSRFPEEFVFENISPTHSAVILKSELDAFNIKSPILDNTASTDCAEVLRLLEELASLPSWGNARDVKTLANIMIRSAITNSDPKQMNAKECGIVLKENDALLCLQAMLKERKDRSTKVPGRAGSQSSTQLEDRVQHLTANPPPPPIITIKHTTQKLETNEKLIKDKETCELQRKEEEELEEKRRLERLEAKRLAKLRSMGVCPEGWKWIKQTGGYLCEGGGHFVTDKELEL